MRVIVLAASVAAGCAASFCSPGDGWVTSWADEFQGDTLDPLSWNVHVGTSDSLCRDSCCTTDNVVVENGNLVMMSKQQTIAGCNYSYTSGAVTTQGKKSWAYSPKFRLCVSAILPGGSAPGTAAGTGIWPAHWMMPDYDICWPDGGEIDILEMINGDGVAHGTYHWESTYPTSNCSYPKGHNSTYGEVSMPKDWGQAYHEYAVEHGPSYLAYVYDGETILNASTSTSNDPHSPKYWPWPFYLLLNTALGGSWPLPVNASTVFPTNHTIDYVRVVVEV